MRTWIEVDFAKIKKNLDTVRGVLPKDCGIIAVVKANAYGHGDIVVAKKLTEFGADTLAVACINEAVTLRKAGVTGKMLILGYTDPADVPLAIENGLTLTCVGEEHLKALSKAAKGLGELKLHLAVNTGMNRIGFDCRTKEQLEAIADAYSAENLNVCGIFSHFSSSDDLSEGAEEYTALQLERFENMLNYLAERGIDPGQRHISNSGAIGKYGKARFDAVRCGALLYGYNTAMDAKLAVEPAMEWKTCITCIRTIDKGDAVSYSRKFTAGGPRIIATLGIGYADGLSRQLSCRGFVLINGRRAPIVGNICMDQLMVDITEIQKEAAAGGLDPVKTGTQAVIIGRSGELVQTADDIAAYGNTCMHEVLSTLGLRVERIYKD